MGAPLGNLNAAKHGKKLVRLTIGEYPKQLVRTRNEARKYRVAIEEEVLRVKGEISINDSHGIDTASAATLHAGLCRWILRQRIGTMSTSDIIACSREMLKAKEIRDRAVRALALDRQVEKSIDALYSLEGEEEEEEGEFDQGEGWDSPELAPRTPQRQSERVKTKSSVPTPENESDD